MHSVNRYCDRAEHKAALLLDDATVLARLSHVRGDPQKPEGGTADWSCSGNDTTGTRSLRDRDERSPVTSYDRDSTIQLVNPIQKLRLLDILEKQSYRARVPVKDTQHNEPLLKPKFYPGRPGPYHLTLGVTRPAICISPVYTLECARGVVMGGQHEARVLHVHEMIWPLAEVHGPSNLMATKPKQVCSRHHTFIAVVFTFISTECTHFVQCMTTGNKGMGGHVWTTSTSVRRKDGDRPNAVS
ncbi:hypothetical protein EDD15DRAFT_2518445 [Pisolithus albus]|nr:hypothetical protein EDD15DRAFT_2518445 [Pisolithus albus]